LGRAREAAGDRDVRIADGSETILQYPNAGLVDKFSIALAPVAAPLGPARAAAHSSFTVVNSRTLN
jgi:dihydrofolate reductase